MAIANVTLTDTFDQWRIKTNQLIIALDQNNGFVTNTANDLANSVNVSIASVKDSGNNANIYGMTYTNSMSNTINIAYRSYANSIGNTSNVFVMSYANSSFLTISNGAVVFAHANAAFDKANSSSEAYAFANGTANSANAYTIVVGAASNTWANNVGAASNTWANNVGAASNTWANNVGAASNTWANVAAQNWANTRLANVVAGQPLTISWSTTNGYTNATINISTSGVTASSYGGSANIPVVVVDSYGRITSASNVSFSGGSSIGDETSSASTFYPVFTTITSGTMTSANVDTAALTFVPSTGTLSATIFNSLSDVNLKHDIQPITNGIDVVKSLNGVSFVWNNNNIKSYGFIAQEIEKVLPELVGSANENKTVNYDGIIAFLVQAVKELSDKIDNLEKR